MISSSEASCQRCKDKKTQTTCQKIRSICTYAESFTAVDISCVINIFTSEDNYDITKSGSQLRQWCGDRI